MQTVVSSTEIILLAEGDTAAAQSNARGHLFEEFIAQLMSVFGYEKPTRSSLNSSSNGIELDVSSNHRLTHQKMIAECKAYTSPLSAKELAAFYGSSASCPVCPDRSRN
jgi:Restriction endonuclease